jgi:hypothetical protein
VCVCVLFCFVGWLVGWLIAPLRFIHTGGTHTTNTGLGSPSLLSPGVGMPMTGGGGSGGVGFRVVAWEEQASAFATADERGQVCLFFVCFLGGGMRCIACLCFFNCKKKWTSIWDGWVLYYIYTNTTNTNVKSIY